MNGVHLIPHNGAVIQHPAVIESYWERILGVIFNAFQQVAKWLQALVYLDDCPHSWTHLSGSGSRRISEIVKFLTSPHKGWVIDENFNFVRKAGISWCLLALMQPFYRLFGADAYSHVRINRVAEKLLSYSREKFFESPAYFSVIKREIIHRLHELASVENKDRIFQIGEEFQALNPPIPPDYLPQIRWPENLDSLNISREQQVQMQNVFAEIMEKMRADPYRYTVRFEKNGPKGNRARYLILIDRWSQILNQSRFVSEGAQPALPEETRYVVPLSLRCTQNQMCPFNIVLLSKKIVGQGAETKALGVYEFSSGKSFVRKKYQENLFLKNLIRERFLGQARRGIVPIINLKELGNKFEIEEPLFTANLNEYIGTEALEPLRVKISLMRDLLAGLQEIHHMRNDGFAYRYQELWGFREDRVPPFNYSLCDIKPSNILLKNEGENWQAGHTDFGTVNPLINGGTIGFKSPERILFDSHANPRVQYRQDFPFRLFNLGQNNRVVHHKVNNGQQSDIWAMGLVFIMLLANRRHPSGLPPLGCIQESAAREVLELRDPELLRNHFRYYIRQQTLNAELNQLRLDTLGRYDPDERQVYNELWALVSSMLKVEAAERPGIDDVFQRFNQIVAQREV